MLKQMGWMASVLLLGLTISGCSDGGKGEEATKTGTLAMPLVSNGPAGVSYRLRNAYFTVSPYGYYYGYGGMGGMGGGGNRPDITLSSESNPNADSIDIEVESGYYYVTLAEGWTMEKIEAGVATTVEAQLLSSQSQWLSVGAHSTSWVRYEFGIGSHNLWFNGELNIDMEVYDNPSQYYGGGVAGSRGYL